eukprot:920703-Alexandrium_andersonii.AAC.1
MRFSGESGSGAVRRPRSNELPTSLGEPCSGAVCGDHAPTRLVTGSRSGAACGDHAPTCFSGESCSGAVCRPRSNELLTSSMVS